MDLKTLKKHRLTKINISSDGLVDDTAQWFHHPFFGLLLNRIHLKALPHANGFISGYRRNKAVVWTHCQVENSVLMA